LDEPDISAAAAEKPKRGRPSRFSEANWRLILGDDWKDERRRRWIIECICFSSVLDLLGAADDLRFPAEFAWFGDPKRNGIPRWELAVELGRLLEDGLPQGTRVRSLTWL
jgi:hypothetical protein